MKYFALLFFTTLLIAYSSCRSSGDLQNPEENINALDAPITWSQLLRNRAGVQIVGEGANLQITIRGGNNSLNATTTPLFVVDGTPMGHNFSQVYSAVPVSDVSRIVVLKGASTAKYGVRGGNGVIEIYTKTN